MSFLLNQLVLAFWNYLNSIFDAYRIMKNKTIAHGVNFGVYGLVVALLCILFRYDIWNIIVFGISAFTNRQFTFDIPLNLRRDLAWDYVTKADPPAAWLDRQEIKLFGRDGRKPIIVYGAMWIVCSIIKIFI